MTFSAVVRCETMLRASCMHAVGLSVDLFDDCANPKSRLNGICTSRSGHLVTRRIARQQGNGLSVLLHSERQRSSLLTCLQRRWHRRHRRRGMRQGNAGLLVSCPFGLPRRGPASCGRTANLGPTDCGRGLDNQPAGHM